MAPSVGYDLATILHYAMHGRRSLASTLQSLSDVEDDESNRTRWLSGGCKGLRMGGSESTTCSESDACMHGTSKPTIDNLRVIHDERPSPCLVGSRLTATNLCMQ